MYNSPPSLSNSQGDYFNMRAVKLPHIYFLREP